MFQLSGIVDQHSPTNPVDSGLVKVALKALGYYQEKDEDFTPYTNEKLFTSIKKFQSDNKLSKDGVIKPRGPTHQKIVENINKKPQALNAFFDFVENYFDMRDANTIGADKYFHCKANYEASNHGNSGLNTAKSLSDLRLMYKKHIKHNSSLDLFQDEGANIYGREALRSGKFSSATEACAPFRPQGLNEKH